MSVPIFSVGLGAIVFLVVLCSLLFVTKYNDKRTCSVPATLLVAISISIAFLSVMLIPLDIYNVSRITDIGTPEDAKSISNFATFLKFLYSISYGSMIVLTFVILPFFYFFFEEDEGEEGSLCARYFHSLKASLFFIILFAVVIGLSFIINKHDAVPDDYDWKKQLINDFSNLDEVLTFSVSVLAFIGLVVYISYVSYGFAMLPIGLIRSRSRVVSEDKEALLLEQERIRFELDTQSEVSNYDNYNNRSYGSRRTNDSRESRQRKSQLERELKNIEERQKHLDTLSDGCSTCWTILTPVRIVFGIFFLALTLLICTQIVLSAIDRIKHSDCGWKCGYAITSPTSINFVDTVLVQASNYFPADFIVFGILVAYIFFAGIVGLVSLGARILFFKLFSFKSKATKPNALIFGGWLIMFMALVLNQQIMTYSPRYTNFGNQFYIDTQELDAITISTQDSSNMDILSVKDDIAQLNDQEIATLPLNVGLVTFDEILSSHTVDIEPITFAIPGLYDPVENNFSQILKTLDQESISSTFPEDFEVPGLYSKNNNIVEKNDEIDIESYDEFVQHLTENKKVACTLEKSTIDPTEASVCTLSQAGVFIQKSNLSKFFGIVQFFSSLIFVFLTVIFCIYGLCRSTRSFSDATTQSDDPDAPNYVPRYRRINY